jgi:hypothetical protein
MATLLLVMCVVLCGVVLVVRHQRDRARAERDALRTECDAASRAKERSAVREWHALQEIAEGTGVDFATLKSRASFLSAAEGIVPGLPRDVYIRAAFVISDSQDSSRALELIKGGVRTTERVVVERYVDQRLAGGRSSDNQRSGLVEEERMTTEADDSEARHLLENPSLLRDQLRCARESEQEERAR